MERQKYAFRSVFRYKFSRDIRRLLWIYFSLDDFNYFSFISKKWFIWRHNYKSTYIKALAQGYWEGQRSQRFDPLWWSVCWAWVAKIKMIQKKDIKALSATLWKRNYCDCEDLKYDLISRKHSRIGDAVYLLNKKFWSVIL